MDIYSNLKDGVKVAFGLLGLQNKGVDRIHFTGYEICGWLYLKDRYGDNMNIPGSIKDFSETEIATIIGVIDMSVAPRVECKDDIF